MPVVHNHRPIGGHLRERAEETFQQAVGRRENYEHKDAWSELEVTKYFLKSFSVQGDLSSFVHEVGTRTSVDVSVDLIALGAACAGCPAPEAPLLAEVGMGVKVEKKSNALLACVIGPRSRGVVYTKYMTDNNVVFPALTGYK